MKTKVNIRIINGSPHAAIEGAFSIKDELKRRGFFFFYPEWAKKLPEAVKDLNELDIDFDFLVVNEKTFTDFSWRGLIDNFFIEGWSYKDTSEDRIKEIKKDIKITIQGYDKDGFHFDVLTFEHEGVRIYYFYRNNEFFFRTKDEKEYHNFVEQLK